MNFTCNTKALRDAVVLAGTAIDHNKPLPAMGCVLIKSTQPDVITVTGSDLELTIRYLLVGVDIDEGGAVLVPQRILANMLNSLADERVSFKNDHTVASITSGKTKFKANVLSAEEYPLLPDITDKKPLAALPMASLRQALRGSVVAAAGQEEPREILRSVRMTAKDGRLSFIATDGRRMSLTHLDTDISDDFDASLTTRLVGRLTPCLDEKPNITVDFYQDNTHVYFDLGGVVFASRFIDQKFPDLKRIIESCSPETVVTLKRKELLESVRRALVLVDKAPSGQLKSLVVDVSGDSMTLSTSIPSVGEFEEDVAIISNSGGNVHSTYNAAFLRDGLASLQSDDVMLKLHGSSVNILQCVDGGLLYGIMPIRSKQD